MTQFTEAGRTRINNERTIPLERYQEDGCEDRAQYLESLCEEYEVGLREVVALADLLGPEEDFDGLVTTLQDGCDLLWG
jgi:hypothetical protein